MTAAAAGSSPSNWRIENVDDFAATILAAAARLDVQPLAVEKDYWVCEALRALTAAFPDDIVFKGGTSLEKLRIIQRFSEDLDLLVVRSYATINEAKSALRRMCNTAAAALGSAVQDARSGGTLGRMHRRAFLVPPLNTGGAGTAGVAEPGRVMLELGQSGGRYPATSVVVTSLLAQQLADAAVPTAQFADLRGFEVPVLHPGRTLLEKLLRVNNFRADETARADDHGWPRIGRQFYDIWALLGDARTLEFLANTDEAASVLADCYRISEMFVPDRPAPADGFAACAAFAVEGELATRLREEHEVAMAQLYYGSTPPSFDAVLERVHQHADLLRIPGPPGE